jgi:segregation and condensation protein B
MEDNRKSLIEAMLLASERPLPLDKIRIVLDNLPTQDTLGLIQELMDEYEKNNRGIRIIEIAGGFQMITAPDFAPFLKKLFKERNVKLSKPSLETLAIIAYKQPLTRSEIELLRNVSVDGVMKNLLDKNLIRICGRKKAPGNPYVYGTTRQFLEHFGLNSLQDLPNMESFSSLAKESQLLEEFPEAEKQAEEKDEPEEIAQ